MEGGAFPVPPERDGKRRVLFAGRLLAWKGTALAARAMDTARALGRVSYTWVPRSRNAHADRLANQAMNAAARALAGDSDPAGSTR